LTLGTSTYVGELKENGIMDSTLTNSLLMYSTAYFAVASLTAALLFGIKLFAPLTPDEIKQAPFNALSTDNYPIMVMILASLWPVTLIASGYYSVMWSLAAMKSRRAA